VVKARLYNPDSLKGQVRIDVRVIDPKNKVVYSSTVSTDTWAGGRAIASFEVNEPHLWSPANPALYRCETTLTSEHGTMNVAECFGLRAFGFLPHGPFHLNGGRLLLRGTQREEDHAVIGPAMTDDLIARELNLIKDMGANFLGLAHHQQSRGAATGPVTIAVDGLTTVSSSSLSVVSSATFSLTAGPNAVTLLPGQNAIVQVSVSTTNGFEQPVALSFSGLPSGVTANFQPPQISPGGFSLLTLTAPGTQSPGSSTLTVSATATAQGILQTQSTSVGLNIQASSGSATFTGQVAVTGPYNTPLVGVTVSFTGKNYTGAQTGCTGSTTESYHYDFNGNVTQFTDRRGVVTTYTYDALNRKVSANFGSGGSVAFTYDAMNRLIQAVDSTTGAVSRNYDLLDRMILENTANGSVSYAYDAGGRRISMQVSGQPTVAYTYDVDNELMQVTQNASVVTFGYDANGRRTKLTLPNGAATNYSYDAASELTVDSYQLGGATLGNLTYAYDADGWRTSVGGSFAQTQLPAAASAAPYSANNQLTQWNGNTLIYDANGNLTSDGVNTYTWDGRNRLVSISGGVSASFRYDAFGRRVSKTIGATTTSYVYDGPNSVQELAGGIASANMLDGLGMDEYFQRTDGSGTVVYLRDALGGTVSLVGGSGNTVAQYTYEPFGNTTSTGTSTNPYQYTGRENDGTGLYYYRARYYDPKIARFISEDPSGFGAGINLYSYVANSPVNFADPSGLCPPPNPCAPIGRAPSPSDYEAKGLTVQIMETSGYPPEEAAGVALNLYNLASFHRGGSLDAQAVGGSTAYANYAFGDYMSAAGFSLSQTLASANAYAAGFSHYGPNVPMDPNYPSLPAVNVANITKGFNDEQNGTLCTPTN